MNGGKEDESIENISPPRNLILNTTSPNARMNQSQESFSLDAGENNTDLPMTKQNNN